MATNITFHPGNVAYDERSSLLNQKGVTIWLTGLSASGKSTIASALEQHLLHLKKSAFRLDGDNIRFGLNKDLGFSPKDREENIRRISEVRFIYLCQVALLFASSTAITITSFISPYKADRNFARELHAKHDPALPFVEVFVDASIEECEKRDPKGLYKKAKAGEIKGMYRFAFLPENSLVFRPLTRHLSSPRFTLMQTNGRSSRVSNTLLNTSRTKVTFDILLYAT